MVFTIASYLLIVLYIGLDGRLRSGEKAKDLNLAPSDRKSTLAVARALVTCILLLLLAPLLNYLHIGQFQFGSIFNGIGIILMLAGIGLRTWATQVLGRFYTRTLVTYADQLIVQDGPYRLIRHPGYSGSLLVWIGAGAAAVNWLVLLAVTLTCCASYLYRINSEEGMLIARFGQEYRAYTRRLIPFIY
jgi:protein-S-isoprenylcysteine O-methyltransferase Ste14